MSNRRQRPTTSERRTAGTPVATITTVDVERMAARYIAACERLGLIPEGARVSIDIGSKTNGIAFRVFTIIPPGSGHHHPPAGGDFLGFTKREAYERLADRSRTLEDAAYTLERRES